MTDDHEFTFRLRVAPTWEALMPAVQRRAAHLGIRWPSGLNAARFPRVYSLTLAGQQRLGADPALNCGVTLWEPPRDVVLPAPVQSWSALHISLGVGAKRAFSDADRPRLAALAVCLDAAGLCLTAAQVGDAAVLEPVRLAAVSVAAVIDTFAAVFTHRLKLVQTGTDHIVDKFAAPPALAGLNISRWRGDASYRLSMPMMQLEIWPTAS